jgi:hypothetical protein
MRIGALLATTLLLGSLSISYAGSINKDDPWDRNHLESLPAELREYIATICQGPPRAQHDFATYNPQERRWRINIEYLRCEGLARSGFRRGRECLNVDFVKVGGSYRIARKDYAECGY